MDMPQNKNKSWAEFTRTSTGQGAAVKVDFKQEVAFEWDLEGQTLDGPGKERKRGA